MSPPGAAISILPALEKLEGFKLASIDATDMIVDELAGAPVWAEEFPAAAIIRHPLRRAAAPAWV